MKNFKKGERVLVTIAGKPSFEAIVEQESGMMLGCGSRKVEIVYLEGQSGGFPVENVHRIKEPNLNFNLGKK